MGVIDQGSARTTKSSTRGNTRRLLVVEDECLVAFSIADDLLELGYTVVGPAFSKDTAQRLAAIVNFDAALVDINLNGENAYEVAEILRSRGIPFMFVTGYRQPPDARFHDVPVLQKPFLISDLQYAVGRLLADEKRTAA